MPSASLTPARRPLTATEQRALKSKIRSLTARARRTSKAAVYTTAGGIFLLWLLTLLASDAPWPVVTGAWLSIGVAIGWGVYREMRTDAQHLHAMAAHLRSALRRNAADVYDIRARAFVEVEEVEDEGACYAFDVGEQVVFVMGQEFYQSAKFPSLDFSLVYVLDEQNRPADMLIDKRGPRVAPLRVIPGATKERIAPEHLEVRGGSLEMLAN